MPSQCSSFYYFPRYHALLSSASSSSCLAEKVDEASNSALLIVRILSTRCHIAEYEGGRVPVASSSLTWDLDLGDQTARRNPQSSPLPRRKCGLIRREIANKANKRGIPRPRPRPRPSGRRFDAAEAVISVGTGDGLEEI